MDYPCWWAWRTSGARWNSVHCLLLLFSRLCSDDDGSPLPVEGCVGPKRDCGDQFVWWGLG